MAIGGVVILGVLLVVLSFGGTSDAQPPRITDHWHEAYGIYNCDAYLADLPEQVNSGIHTHGDGLIHVEPSSSAETGKNANIATFVKGYPGLAISQTEIKLPDGQVLKDGGKCGDKTANVKIFYWANANDASPKIVTNPTKDMLIKNDTAIAFAFVPDGVTPPKPPSIAALADPNAGEAHSSTTVPPGASSTTTIPPGASTTEAPSTTQPAPTTTAAP